MMMVVQFVWLNFPLFTVGITESGILTKIPAITGNRYSEYLKTPGLATIQGFCF
jgi:hypothetical protein